jgi:hypothetical protein
LTDDNILIPNGRFAWCVGVLCIGGPREEVNTKLRANSGASFAEPAIEVGIGGTDDIQFVGDDCDEGGRNAVERASSEHRCRDSAGCRVAEGSKPWCATLAKQDAKGGWRKGWTADAWKGM